MPRMIRKQVYVEQRQEVLLKRLARERGTSEADIIREAIDRQAGRLLFLVVTSAPGKKSATLSAA